MSLKSLKEQIALGEDSSRQFKVDIRNVESLASQMAAFANSEGGVIYIGRTHLLQPVVGQFFDRETNVPLELADAIICL